MINGIPCMAFYDPSHWFQLRLQHFKWEQVYIFSAISNREQFYIFSAILQLDLRWPYVRLICDHLTSLLCSKVPMLASMTQVWFQLDFNFSNADQFLGKSLQYTVDRRQRKSNPYVYFPDFKSFRHNVFQLINQATSKTILTRVHASHLTPEMHTCMS